MKTDLLIYLCNSVYSLLQCKGICKIRHVQRSFGKIWLETVITAIWITLASNIADSTMRPLTSYVENYICKAMNYIVISSTLR